MINNIISKFIKSFFSEEHIEGQIKMWLAGVGTLLIHNGYQSNDTWAKTCGTILASIAAIYHFVQSHNNNTPPAA